MQEKESKTNWHFRISIIKSAVRGIGYGFLIFYPNSLYLNLAGLALTAAELLGILEEL